MRGPSTSYFGVQGALTRVGLILAIAAVILTPIACLLATSFDVADFHEAFRFGLANWAQVMSQPRLVSALVNTVSLAIVQQVLSLIIATVIAWLIACTDLPGRSWCEVGFWIALFMPPLPTTLAWVLLLSGSSGLVNKALMMLPFVQVPIFHIYSWWGIVWVHLMGTSVAFKVFLLVPSFRVMDSSFVEAARTSGASLASALFRVMVPLMTPVLLVTALIGFVRSMQGFEVELVLGAPAGIDVYSTAIFRAMAGEPPHQGLASALSIAFVIALLPFVLLQLWHSRDDRHASVTGKIRPRQFSLGSLRWPAFAIVIGVLAMMTIIPLSFLLLSTFMRLFGHFDLYEPFTLDHWRAAVGRGDVMRSLWNTIRLGVVASLAGMVIYSVLAYYIFRWRNTLMRVLDFLIWLPALVPGVVLSLGLMQSFVNVPGFKLLYGTLLSLVIAVLIGSLTVGVQYLRANMQQLGRELEEAGWASGGSRIYVFRRIVVPLIAPSIIVIGLEVFASANSAVAILALLGVGSLQPLSILQLNFVTSGELESAAVVGFTIMVLTVLSALSARMISHRTGIARSE